MPIHIKENTFSPYDELTKHQEKHLHHDAALGAVVSFVGVMRDFNEGEQVSKMYLEHYPGMTEKYLEKIMQTAKTQQDFLDALIIHRVGEIAPTDPIVLVAVWSTHREAAFDTCRYIIEELKHKAPFWKKETLQESERWVRCNTARSEKSLG
jgi:molybdopterin synthase catalytic subunit